MYHFLDSTCKWYHMIFVFLCLTYFTSCDNLRVHPCCCKWHFVGIIKSVHIVSGCILVFSRCSLGIFDPPQPWNPLFKRPAASGWCLPAGLCSASSFLPLLSQRQSRSSWVLPGTVCKELSYHLEILAFPVFIVVVN